ncbi:MAG: HEPN domain-containing protein [Patescibacteria group bacterium]
MNKIYKKWVPYIKRDLRAAGTLYKSSIHSKSNSWHDWTLVIWHCHQVVEKSLKMIIVAKDFELLKIHDLPRLLELANLTGIPLKWKETLHQLNQYYMPTRYPDLPLQKSYPKATAKIAKTFLQFSKKIFIWAQEQSFLKKS